MNRVLGADGQYYDLETLQIVGVAADAAPCKAREAASEKGFAYNITPDNIGHGYHITPDNVGHGYQIIPDYAAQGINITPDDALHGAAAARR